MSILDPLRLKKKCRKMNGFLKVEIFLSVLSVNGTYVLMVSTSFESFPLCYKIINFSFAALKLINNFKMPTETLFEIPFSVIGRALTCH